MVPSDQDSTGQERSTQLQHGPWTVAAVDTDPGCCRTLVSGMALSGSRDSDMVSQVAVQSTQISQVLAAVSSPDPPLSTVPVPLHFFISFPFLYYILVHPGGACCLCGLVEWPGFLSHPYPKVGWPCELNSF